MAEQARLIARAGSAALGAALIVLVLAALYLAADAEGLGPGLASWYPYVFVAAAVAAAALAVAIVQRLRRLRRALRNRQPGARLNRRLLLLLLVLVIPPLLLVYGFSVRFISATVDSWLRANSTEILGEALEVGRALLAERRQLAERDLEALARELQGQPAQAWPAVVDRALDRLDAAQIAVFDGDGRLLALAAASPDMVRAQPPPDELRLALRSNRQLVMSEPSGEGMQLRALRALEEGPAAPWVQVLFRLPESYAQGLLRVEQGIVEARKAQFLRQSLKLAFVLILSFVLLLALLLAVLLAFVMARRVVAPIAQLTAAAARVSEGDYTARVRAEGETDELGFLLQAFNRMLADLQSASEQARCSQEETERQRAYLETVLQRLSTAVLVVGPDGTVHRANAAARKLLDAPVPLAGRRLAELGACARRLGALLGEQLEAGRSEFSLEFPLELEGGPRLWLVRGARLPDGNLLAVVDDTTAIDRARRDAAWAEVARRLAHEVKNPLTPIQLAAERLRRRVLPHLAGPEAEVMDRATHTIVAQVEALKTLVNAFGDYARTPVLQLRPLDLPGLLGEMAELYAGDPGLDVRVEPDPALPSPLADAGRVRQVLHNLIKNANEAGARTVRLATAEVVRPAGSMLALVVEDDGPGLPEGFDASWFEPYRSTKPKGTGLGLAIVRRIAEEHGGLLEAGVSSLGGARFQLLLPLAPASFS